MTQTDRKYYCSHKPYVDAPQSIGNGVTISAPHMVGNLLLDLLIFHGIQLFLWKIQIFKKFLNQQFCVQFSISACLRTGTSNGKV